MKFSSQLIGLEPPRVKHKLCCIINKDFFRKTFSKKFLTDFKQNFYFLWYLLNLIYFRKVPERLAPGIFDLIGHSHHFMHIGTTVGVYAHYYLVEIEFQKYSKSRYSPLHILSIFFIVTVIFILYLRRFSRRFVADIKPTDYNLE